MVEYSFLCCLGVRKREDVSLLYIIWHLLYNTGTNTLEEDLHGDEFEDRSV